MSIRKLRAGRVPGVTQSQYIGEKGSIFWNELTGEFRLSDGDTPGGSRVGFPIASSTEIGGLKLGPGTLLNNDGQLVIDSTGLDFSFGDFQASTPGNGAATLSSIQPNQDVDIVSNGTGVINMVGDFHVHRTADYTPDQLDVSTAVFAVKGDGQVQMKVPLADSTVAAFEIVGNDTGLFLPPNQTGVILHITGNSGLVSRSYFDANANYALLAGRRYNGTQLAPTRVKNNELILRLVAQAAGATTDNNTATFQAFGPARISFYANEDQTPTAQGGRIQFEVTKNGFTADSTGTNTITVATVDAQNGITATKFNGPLTGNVTGNVTGNAGTVTNGVYTSGSYSDPSWLTISKSKVGLSAVENTALSTWAGTSSITTVGTLTSGTIGTGFTAIANSALAHSTISGIALGNNLAALTIGTHLTGTSYNGSAGITIATDATTDATASVLVARDSNGMVTAQNYKGNTRDAGTLTAGSTLTINYATDHHVLVNITGAITIAHQNITAGRNVKVIVINATGGNLAVTTGLADLNVTGGNAAANVNANRMGAYEFISFGTTTTTLYCNLNK